MSRVLAIPSQKKPFKISIDWITVSEILSHIVHYINFNSKSRQLANAIALTGGSERELEKFTKRLEKPATGGYRIKIN